MITELIMPSLNFKKTFPACLSHQSCDYHVNITCQKNGRQHQEMTVQKIFIITFNVKTAITLSYTNIKGQRNLQI